jgi:hypothetical protein
MEIERAARSRPPCSKMSARRLESERGDDDIDRYSAFGL